MAKTALKGTITKAEFDKLDAAKQEFYDVDPDNPERYIADVDIAGTASEQRILNTLKKVRKEKDDATKALARFKVLGDLTDEQLSDLADALQGDNDDGDDDSDDDGDRKGGRKGDRKGDRGKSDKVDLAAFRKKIEEEVRQREVKPLMEKVSTYEKTDAERTFTDLLTAAATKGGVDPKQLKAALKLTRDRFQRDETGKLVVLDDNGEQTGQDPDKFFAVTFKEEAPWAYPGRQASGTGDVPSGGRQGMGGKVVLTATQAKDNRAYREAKDRAQKEGKEFVIVEDA